MLRRTRALACTILAGAVSLLLYASLLSTLALPSLISAPALRERIESLAARRLQAEVAIGSLQLDTFPFPTVTLHGLEVQPGDDAWRLRATSLYVAPDLKALTSLKLRLSRIVAEAPRLSLPGLGADGLEAALPSGRAPKRTVQALVNRMPLGLRLEVRRGRVDLPGLGKGAALRDIHGRLVLDRRVELELHCSSGSWSTLSLELQGHLEEDRARGSMTVTELEAGPLLKKLLPRAAPSVIPAPITLRLEVSSEDLASLQGEARVETHSLELRSAQGSAVLEGLTAQAGFRLSPEGARGTLQALAVSDPGLSLSGEIERAGPDGPLALELRSPSLSLGSVRGLCLRLFPGSDRAQSVFEILREGSLKDLRLSSEAPSAAGLPAALSLRADLRGGRVRLPRPKLTLSEVSGRMAYANGTLHGRDLSAAAGGLQARDGRLELGLDPALEPFALSLAFRGDLAGLPDILRQTLPPGQVKQELERLKILQGRSAGRLELSRAEPGWTYALRAGELSLTVGHPDLPHSLALEAGTLSLDQAGLRLQGLDLVLGESSLRGIQAEAGWAASEADFSLAAGSGRFELETLLPWLAELRGRRLLPDQLEILQGRLETESLRVRGPVRDAARWTIEGSGRVSRLRIGSDRLPGRLQVDQGGFSLQDGRLSLSQWQTRLLDSRLSITCSSRNVFDSPLPERMHGVGALGPETLGWARSQGLIPETVAPNAPLKVQQASLSRSPDGPASFAGDLETAGGMRVSLEGSRTARTLRLERLELRDERSEASLEAKIGPDRIQAGFSGLLERSSLEELLGPGGLFLGRLEGAFSLELTPRPLRLVRVDGELAVREAALRPPGLPALRLERLQLEEQLGSRLAVLPSRISWLGSSLALSGSIDIQGQKNLLDLQASSGTVNGTAWQEAFASGIGGPEGRGGGDAGQGLLAALEGHGNLVADRLLLAGRELKDVDVRAVVQPAGGVWVTVRQAELCGLPFSGSWHQAAGGDPSCTLSLAVQDRDLGPALACLFEEQGTVSGRFDLKARTEGGCSSRHELLRSLEGDFLFTARDGRIYRLNLLAKIIALLNSTEILVGKLPDLDEEGFGYTGIRIQGAIKGQTLEIQEGLVDGESMELAFRGPVNLADRTLDLVLLASPLKTVDRVVKKIPVLSGLLGGNLVSIPVRVSGELADPTIVPLSPTAVSSEVFSILKRTINLPVSIIQPFLPGHGKDSQAGGNATAEPPAGRD